MLSRPMKAPQAPPLCCYTGHYPYTITRVIVICYGILVPNSSITVLDGSKNVDNK